MIGSQIKHIPIAGRDITQFVMNMIRDRDENVPPAQCLEISKKIKVHLRDGLLCQRLLYVH